MTAFALALIGGTVVLSSFISAVFGMAGGMVLLGVLLIYFDVATGMILFSIIQLTTNGWRTLHWRQYVRWPIFWWYAAGAVLAFVVMRAIAFMPNKAMVYILLGLMPFAVQVLPRNAQPNIEWRGVPFFTGIFTTIIQFMAGVGGLFFDIFFQKSSLDRRTTNATKASAQTFSHFIRAAYFGSLAGFGDLKVEIWAPAIVLAILGAVGAPYVLERMTDHSFRQWTLDDHLHPRGGLSDPRRTAALAGRLIERGCRRVRRTFQLCPEARSGRFPRQALAASRCTACGTPRTQCGAAWSRHRVF